MSHQADSILLCAPPVPRSKVPPKGGSKFLANATEEERVACVRLIRVMRTNTTYKEGYWLSFFLQGLLKLDATIEGDEVLIESAEKLIKEMQNLENWSNWLRGASTKEHLKDHPALAWIRQQEDEVTNEESTQESEVRRIKEMFFAPDDRSTTTVRQKRATSRARKVQPQNGHA